MLPAIATNVALSVDWPEELVEDCASSEVDWFWKPFTPPWPYPDIAEFSADDKVVEIVVRTVDVCTEETVVRDVLVIPELADNAVAVADVLVEDAPRLGPHKLRFQLGAIEPAPGTR